MPTYEYACKECGEHLEVVQKFTDEPLTRCPACQGPLRKVFGSIGISFKGSGFYKNDSRVTGSGKKEPAEKASGDDGDSKPKTDAAAKGDGAKSDSAKTESSKTDSSKSDSGKKDKGSSTAAAS